MALAGADACREVAGVEPVLKWPNDLLLDGAKLAGVLAEAEFAGPTLRAVIVGIGINVAWPGPPEAGGTCLDDVGGTAQPVDRQVLLHRLLEALEPRCELLEEVAGRRVLADEVRRRCATLGQRVRVILGGEELSGVAAAIDDAGRLVVETAAGPRAVSAGDVVHLRPDEDREPVPSGGVEAQSGVLVEQAQPVAAGAVPRRRSSRAKHVQPIVTRLSSHGWSPPSVPSSVCANTCPIPRSGTTRPN